MVVDFLANRLWRHDKPAIIVIGCIAVLVFQNIFIFWQHYFSSQVFPWDFLAAYHAVPFYWMKLKSYGLDSSWVPFQGMGYPLYLNLQSSLYYPVLQVLAYLGVEYSLHIAVVVQCLHVLFGAFGAYFCARSMDLGWKSALFAGVIYQGFGGFYSNSEHVDIVRVYALIPWILCPVFSSWRSNSRYLKKLLLFYPFIVMLLITGGYVGGVISVLFVTGVVLTIKTFWYENFRKRGVLIIFLMLLGVALSAIHWLPAMINMDLIARSNNASSLSKDYIQWIDLFTFTFSSDGDRFFHDISMRSIFIGIPALAFILIGVVSQYRPNPWVLLTAIFSLLMGTGALLSIISILISPLSFSRFVIADYKGLLAFSMIMLGAQSFEKFFLSPRNLFFCFLLMTLWFILGCYFLDFDFKKDRTEIVGIVLMTICVILYMGKSSRSASMLWITFLIALVLIDWYRINGRHHFYNTTMTLPSFNVGIKEDGKPYGLLAGMTGNAGCREGRIDFLDKDYANKPWRGYYTGEYLMGDYGGSANLSGTKKILSDSNLRLFAEKSWLAIEIEEARADHAIKLLESSPSLKIKCINFDGGRQIFDVNSDSQFSIVENERYFDGWTAILKNANGEVVSSIEPENFYGFRQWKLPMGSYRVEPKFVVPGKSIAIAVSIFSSLIYLFTLILMCCKPFKRVYG